MNRVHISQAIQTAVLAASRRRCCLCAWLEHDFTQKQGQLAHLNKDHSDARFDNLVFLCLPHHDQYDTLTSQSKGLTENEVRHHRDWLYDRFDAEPALERISAADVRDTRAIESHYGVHPSAVKAGAVPEDDITTDDVYTAYSAIDQEGDLLAWVATWPAFPESDKERVLEDCRARRLVVAGPVKHAVHLPGVFWRLEVQERRARRTGFSPLFLYANDLPSLKMIIAGQRTFVAPEPEGRTTRYLDLGRSLDRLKALFLSDLEGARTVQEEVYLFLLGRLQQGSLAKLDSQALMQAFEDEIRTQHAPREARSYDLAWVESLFRKWVPWCVRQVADDRGWTSLELQRQHSERFLVRLRRGGKRLVDRHEAYLRQTKQHVVVPFTPERRGFPKLRIVVTNRCNLECSYCPPENEDYAGGGAGHTMADNELSVIIRAGLRVGCRAFSITGGEPLAPAIAGDIVVETLTKEILNPTAAGARFAIQTNGRHLMEYLDRLEPIRSALTLKVSVDAVGHVERVAKSGNATEVLKAANTARSRGFDVGVNFVLTKDTATELHSVASWCREKGVYLKILDLNWYSDIGRRTEGCGSRRGILFSDLYWEQQYLSPLDFYEEGLRDQYGTLHPCRVVYGIPLLETAREANGFFIRIKDSSIGSHYSPECRVCPNFVDRRRCQEGLYEPWVTPDLRLKLCRHRPDLHEDLSEAVRLADMDETANVMHRMIERFYIPSNFIPLRAANSVA